MTAHRLSDDLSRYVLQLNFGFSRTDDFKILFFTCNVFPLRGPFALLNNFKFSLIPKQAR